MLIFLAFSVRNLKDDEKLFGTKADDEETTSDQKLEKTVTTCLAFLLLLPNARGRSAQRRCIFFYWKWQVQQRGPYIA